MIWYKKILRLVFLNNMINFIWLFSFSHACVQSYTMMYYVKRWDIVLHVYDNTMQSRKGSVSAAILTFHSHSKIELSLRKSQLVRMTSIFSLQSNLLWTTQKSFTILIMKIEFCIWSYTYQNNHINCYFNCERLSGLWRIFQCYQLQDPKTIGVVLKSATLLSF